MLRYILSGQSQKVAEANARQSRSSPWHGADRVEQRLVATLAAVPVVDPTARFLRHLSAWRVFSEEVTKNLLIVSSTLRIRQLASTAAWMALTLTRLGSQMNAFILSRTPSLSKSTPAQTLPFRCSTRKRVRMLVASKPALSHSCRGMTSRALANDLIIACCFLGMFWSAYL